MAPERTPAAARVLIVEDDSNILISIEFIIRNVGYEVAVSRDGSQALQTAQSWRPDLIVLDIMLPLVSGFEVCRQLRASPELSGVKILLLTARSQEREIKKGLELGANAYLTKPFATRELIETVNRLLGA